MMNRTLIAASLSIMMTTNFVVARKTSRKSDVSNSQQSVENQNPSKKYEYKFIRLKHSFLFRSEPKDYQEIIEREGLQGWRLNQILAPTDRRGTYSYELIFEREMSS